VKTGQSGDPNIESLISSVGGCVTKICREDAHPLSYYLASVWDASFPCITLHDGCNNGGGGGNFLKVKRSVRKCKRTRKQFFLLGRSFLKVYAWRRGTVKTHSFALAGPFSLCEKGPAKAKLWVFTVPRRHAYTFKKVRKGTWSAPTKEQGFPCK